MLTIDLIRPGNNTWYSKVPQFAQLVAPPIGLHILKAKLDQIPDVQTRIFDGLLHPLPTDMQFGDIVGISTLYANYESALQIAERAADQGSRVYLGGPYVSCGQIAENALRNRPYLAGVVRGDGEIPICQIAQGYKPSCIGGLVYREGSQIISNDPVQAEMTTLFDIDAVKIPDPDICFPISLIRGCAKAVESTVRCIFCSIFQDGIRLMEPELAWRQIAILREKGLHFFFETGDTFLVGDYPKRLLAARPPSLADTTFRAYSIPNQITEESADILAELGAWEAYVGIETGSDELLQIALKTYRTADTLRALEILSQRGFSLHTPFLYGLPGETSETAKQTFQLAEHIVSAYHPKRLVTSLCLAFPGTMMYNMLLHHERALELYQELPASDIIDWGRLVRTQIECLTDTDYTTLRDCVMRTRRLIAEPNTSGFGTNDEYDCI